jgi:hypothetical protein
LGDTEKLANWQLWKNKKKPYRSKQRFSLTTCDLDKVKIDALLVKPTDYAIFTANKLITTVDEVSVDTPALLAIVKLETLAVRGNAIKLPNDFADLIWCPRRRAWLYQRRRWWLGSWPGEGRCILG